MRYKVISESSVIKEHIIFLMSHQNGNDPFMLEKKLETYLHDRLQHGAVRELDVLQEILSAVTAVASGNITDPAEVIESEDDYGECPDCMMSEDIENLIDPEAEEAGYYDYHRMAKPIIRELKLDTLQGYDRSVQE